jgi:transposase
MKLSILREVGVGGATVTDVSRRHDVTRQHIYQWRRQMKGKGLWPAPEGISFLALEEPGQPATSVSKSHDRSSAEIGFANGRTLRCPPGMSDAEIIQLIRLVETS